MKTMRLLTASVFLLCFVASFAQSKLADSQRRSSEIHIYQISKEDLRRVHLKEDNFNEGMLKTFITKYKVGEQVPTLERGNYVEVGVTGNQLVYNELTIDDLYAKIIPSDKFVICLYDSLGNIISDAEIKRGASKLKYDKETQTYYTSKVKDEQAIEIAHNNVYHYWEVTNDRYYFESDNFFESTWNKTKSTWNYVMYGFKDLFRPSYRPARWKYNGFVVFNKPKYKPGETVKFKANLTKLNGEPYNKPVNIRLEGRNNGSGIDTLLVRLDPYRPGMYSHEFKLTDDLGLRLDERYTIYLVTDDKKGNKVGGYLRYEDYELKSIDFSLKSDKKEYAQGDSIKLKMKVTDENNMAVYDGKIEVLVTPERFNQNKMNSMQPVFIPDTLWSHTIDLFNVSEKELIIPDSVFPSNINLDFKVNCTYLSADNEKHSKSLSLEKSNCKHTLDFSLDKGLLTIKELHLGKSQPARAEVIISGENDECLYKDSVMLPHTLAVPWLAADVSVKTKNTVGYHFNDDVKDNQLAYRFYRSNDSIYLEVNNPANIPFWYTIRKMKKEIAKGYVTQLNYANKAAGENGYSMQLSYLFGEESKVIEEELPFIQKNITIDVTTPTTVYPGQKTNVQVAVSDKKGKPVKDVDITAYSFTSKFKDYSMPRITIGGKAKQAKRPRMAGYEMDDDMLYNKTSHLTKERWMNAMALDTIEYYKFLYPDTYYVHTMASQNRKAQISPFVVVDGEVQGIYMLWIDGRLYYSNQSDQLGIYTFEVELGKHDLRFRTYNREVVVSNFYLDDREKHIISFNAGKPHTEIPNKNPRRLPLIITSRLLDKKERIYLSDKEEHELRSQLITVNNNFGEIELPNIHQRIEIPGYIKTGNTLYYLNHTNKSLYNRTLRAEVKTPILAGPFPKRNYSEGLSDIASVYAGDTYLTNIEIEGGNQYTLYPDYQKIKQWDKPVINKHVSGFNLSPDFLQQPLTKIEIENRLKDKILNAMQSASGLVNAHQQNKNLDAAGCQLNLTLGRDTTGALISPTLIFIEPQQEEEDSKFHQLHYGRTRSFSNLPAEALTLHLIFKDSTSYSYPLKLHKGGENYLKLDSIAGYDTNPDVARTAYNLFNKGVRVHNAKNPFVSKGEKDSFMLSSVFNNNKPDMDYKNRKVVVGTVYDEWREPIIGAAVIAEETGKATHTDLDGKFEIEVEGNTTLKVLYIGYTPKEIKVSTGNRYDIILKADSQHLEETVVVGHGGVTRASWSRKSSASINTISAGISEQLSSQALQVKVAGLGAANGAIMIETNSAALLDATNETDILSEDPGNMMRRNFHDDAFWQPRLKTNEKGEVNFEVTYPDDITNWNAYFIALGGKKQTDTKQINIKSFKALSARLSTPRFAIRGDSLNAVGKVANHFGDSLQLTRTIALDNKNSVKNVKAGNSLVDYIPAVATSGDSLTIAYSVQMENGYFDGEERSLPILEQGLLQTHGDFRVINTPSTYTLNTNPALGTVTIHAEASSLEVFLREVENIEQYPYKCNEQMASKIKALLAKKYIFKAQGKEFKDDKKINSLIRELNKNKNKKGLWGWWNKSESVMWISKHIINTLLDAEEAGYKTELDKSSLASAFEQELKNNISALSLVVDKKAPFAKGELLDWLVLLRRLDTSIDCKTYLYSIDSQLKSQTTQDKLKTMLATSFVGLQDSIQIDSLLHLSNKTILGSLYWGEAVSETPSLRYIYCPHETNAECTLLAYQILKNAGGHEQELESIRNYFFEQRQRNSWNNIYESSRIIQTIMPDALSKNNDHANVSMTINGNKVTAFPYTTEMSANEKIEVSKTGTMPLFITAYQREWNKAPQKEEDKGFKISTAFKMNNDSIANLKEGKSTTLQATLTLTGDAEYVQIEVPIPAGCTYDSKSGGDHRKEAHREYYKEKVVIFCNKLSKGEHIFSIELLPRYTGRYTLNPAKTELMYFPTFYGNEGIKTVRIR